MPSSTTREPFYPKCFKCVQVGRGLRSCEEGVGGPKKLKFPEKKLNQITGKRVGYDKVLNSITVDEVRQLLEKLKIG